MPFLAGNFWYCVLMTECSFPLKTLRCFSNTREFIVTPLGQVGVKPNTNHGVSIRVDVPEWTLIHAVDFTMFISTQCCNIKQQIMNWLIKPLLACLRPHCQANIFACQQLKTFYFVQLEPNWLIRHRFFSPRGKEMGDENRVGNLILYCEKENKLKGSYNCRSILYSVSLSKKNDVKLT